MERSLFPDGVVVKQKDLVYTDRAKIQQILRRHTNMGVMGVVSGGVIRVSSNTFGVKIVPFVAYTPNGELINYQLIVDNVPLANSTANALNYVLAVYTETEGSPSPHESLGLQMNTRTTAACRIRVLDAVSYAALPATSTNLDNDALDRTVLLAVVTAQGNGVALQPGNIKNSTAWIDILSTDNTTTITGVEIVSVSPDTQVGSGTLTYTPTTGGNPDRLSWRAPNDNVGAPVDVTGNGNVTLYSANGTAMVVAVTFASLPGGITQINDVIEITSLYSQDVPRFSARDEHHRHMIGSGTPTPHNPHGMTLGDLVGGGTDPIIQKHQDIFHANGIGKNSTWGLARSVIKPTIQHNNNPTIDVVAIGGIGTGEIVVVNGATLTEGLASQTVSFESSIGYLELYGIYIDSVGTAVKSKRVRMNANGDPWGQAGQDPFAGVVQIINVSDDWVTQADVTLRYDNDGTNYLCLYDAANNIEGAHVAVPTGGDSVIRLYWHDNVKWVDVWFDVSRGGALTAPSESLARIFPKMDADTHLLLAYVVSHGTASPILGYGEWNTISALTDNLIDLRKFGTTDLTNIRDDSIDAGTPKLVRDVLGNGFINGLTLKAVAGNEVLIDGGVVYFNGQRYEVDTTKFSGLSNTTHYIYVAINSSNKAVLSETPTLAIANTGLLMWTIVVAGGAVTNTTLNARKLSITIAEDLAAHITDTVDAHDASAISFTPAAGVVATDVQAAIQEVNGNGTSVSFGANTGAINFGGGDIASVVITTSNKRRPIIVQLMPASAGGNAYIHLNVNDQAILTWYVNNVAQPGVQFWQLYNTTQAFMPPGIVAPLIFIPTTDGPYTIKLSVSTNGTGNFEAANLRLVAYEL